MKKIQGFTPYHFLLKMVGGRLKYPIKSTGTSGAGFTLIELLIVIAIIAILAAIIFVAVDPARRLAEARNAERWSSVNSILNAVLKYTVDNEGFLPSALESATVGTYYVIGSDGVGCDAACGAPQTATNGSCLNLTGDLVDEYISSLPIDPLGDSVGADSGNTDYYIRKTPNGRIQVGSCDPERNVDIEVSR